jgi:flagellar assembly protein FliH
MRSIDQEKENILKSAYDDGYNEGEQTAYSKIEPELNRLMQTIADISRQNKENLDKIKPDLLALSIKIAEKIVHTTLSHNPEVFHAIIDEALTKITDKEKVIIRVNPEQIDHARAHRDAILRAIPEIKNLDLQSDPLVDFGGCIIETKMGYVDSSMPMKLETLSKVLMQTYANE